jgi:uncharacterized protein
MSKREQGLEIMHHNDSKIFYDEVDRLLNDPKVRGMSSFSQHKGTNTLRHSIKVAQASFKLAEHLGWDIDERELARGALLHDYYQYDIQERGLGPYRHGTSHPGIAAKNAEADFSLNDKELNIIKSHMWPLTLLTPPRSREAVLVCMADKYIATKEMVFHRF